MKKVIALVLVIAMILGFAFCGKKDKTKGHEGEWLNATVTGYRCIDKYSAKCEVFVEVENNYNNYSYFSTGAPEIGASVKVFLTSTGEILDVK